LRHPAQQVRRGDCGRSDKFDKNIMVYVFGPMTATGRSDGPAHARRRYAVS